MRVSLRTGLFLATCAAALAAFAWDEAPGAWGEQWELWGRAAASVVLCELVYQLLWRNQRMYAWRRRWAGEGAVRRRAPSRSAALPPPADAVLRLLSDLSAAAGGGGGGAVSHLPSAPPRSGARVTPLVDGAEFFAAATAAIRGARRRVFIANWQLSPHVRTHPRAGAAGLAEWKRGEQQHPGGAAAPAPDGGGAAAGCADPVCDLLRAAAERGVAVRVLLWDEPPVMGNASGEVSAALRALHPGVEVVRHGPGGDGGRLDLSHHQKYIVVDDAVAIIGGLDLAYGRWDTRDHPLTDPGGLLWHGPDYYNPSRGEQPKADAPPAAEYVDRATEPRMPWHDVALRVEGAVARDAARAFVRRWNHHTDVRGGAPFSPVEMVPGPFTFRNLLRAADEQEGYRRLTVPPLPPAGGPASPSLLRRIGQWALDVSGGGLRSGGGGRTVCARRGGCVAQLLCSLGPWAGAEHGTEASILGAYCGLIEAAEHFIYIENQFFLSRATDAPSQRRNPVARVLLGKLREKIRARAEFRVVICLTHPEEPGENGDTILRAQYDTISRGEGSIMGTLAAEFPGQDLAAYIHWGFLRTYAFLAGRPVQDKIFIHAKLLIVDDRYAVVASANINDRSLLGWRDTELGVVYTDTVRCERGGGGWRWSGARGARGGRGPLPGAARSVHELRVRLWEEHLGMPNAPDAGESPVADPCCAEVYEGMWRRAAARNTAALEAVFPGVQADRIRTAAERARAVAEPPDAGRVGELAHVRGHLCDHPLRYLCDEPKLGYQLPIDELETVFL